MLTCHRARVARSFKFIFRAVGFVFLYFYCTFMFVRTSLLMPESGRRCSLCVLHCPLVLHRAFLSLRFRLSLKLGSFDPFAFFIEIYSNEATKRLWIRFDFSSPTLRCFHFPSCRTLCASYAEVD